MSAFLHQNCTASSELQCGELQDGIGAAARILAAFANLGLIPPRERGRQRPTITEVPLGGVATTIGKSKIVLFKLSNAIDL